MAEVTVGNNGERMTILVMGGQQLWAVAATAPCCKHNEDGELIF